MLQSTRKCIRKSLKSCKNIEGKSFALGPKLNWVTMDSENLRYFAEMKKRCAKFFICCKVHENVSENH